MMKSKDFVARAKLALTHKTMYVSGAFGAPATPYNKTRYSNKANADRTAEIAMASADTFFFDCVCLIKGILWGWDADVTQRNGGAIYASNGVPDVGTDSMMAMCTDSNTDFTNIVPGAMVWMPGHVGIYIGDGMVIEATAKWESKVLLSVCQNVVPDTKKTHRRQWMRWGKLPWVDYTEDRMTYEDFKEYMERYLREQKEMPADPWAVDALAWAKDEGLIVGDATGNQMPQAPLSTERAAVILKATVDKYGRK